MAVPTLYVSQGTGGGSDGGTASANPTRVPTPPRSTAASAASTAAATSDGIRIKIKRRLDTDSGYPWADPFPEYLSPYGLSPAALVGWQEAFQTHTWGNYTRLDFEALPLPPGPFLKPVVPSGARRYLVLVNQGVDVGSDTSGPPTYVGSLTFHYSDTGARVIPLSKGNLPEGFITVQDNESVFIEPPLASGAAGRVWIKLVPFDLQPDAGMAGVIGDVVKSAKAGSTIKHFVTPKKTAELNQDYVILTAAGITADQITEGNANQILAWDGGEADPDDPLKRRVRRDATGSGPTEVKVKVKASGDVLAQMDVWVVWADGKVAYIVPAEKPEVRNDPQIGPITTINGGGFIFTHTIQPEEIITDLERPNLEGTKAKSDGPPPKNGTHPLHTNEKLADGANNKWDASRQVRFKHSNPNGLPADAFSQPAPLITVPDFPTSPIEGNDDSTTTDEVPFTNGLASGTANDPYQNRSQKILWSADAPAFSISKGEIGNTYEFHIQLREFSRVELNGRWFRIGDYKPWRKRVFMKKIRDVQKNIDYWWYDQDPLKKSVIEDNLNDFYN